MSRYRLTVAALIFAVNLPVAAAAAPSGLAWDSVTKFSMNADPSSLQPGDFNSDFAAASAVEVPEENSGGGLFAQMHQAMSMGQRLAQLMQTGLAEHHYVAGSKERIDNLNTQTATISDCAARTITTLDLRRKTYKVDSMDHPSNANAAGNGGGPGAHFNDSGTRVAITLTNTALGSRDVGGQPTSGYRANMVVTETSTSGETQTQNANMIGYYSSYGNATPSCARSSGAVAQAGMPMMASYGMLLRALGSAGLDNRFTVKQSGPPLPLGKLSMYAAVTIAGGRAAGGTMINERGNVRAISATDPIFSIPADFTQQQ